MRSFYSYLLAVCLLCTGVAASAAPVTTTPDGPGKPALVTTLPAGPGLVAQQYASTEQATAASPQNSQKKKKSGSKKVWLLLGIGVALAVVRVLL